MKEKNFFLLIRTYRKQLLGIAILGIFCVHSNEWVWNIEYLFLEHILSEGSIGVEIFLLLSGVGLFFSYNNSRNLLDFYFRRIKRIFPSYFLIAGIGYGILVFGQGDKNIISFLYLFSTIAFWKDGIGTVWFISFIILMYALYPLIYRICKCINKGGGWGITLLMLVSFTGVFVWADICPEMYQNIEVAIARIPIFLLGCMIPFVEDKIEISAIKCATISFFLFVLFRVIRIAFISDDDILCEMVIRVSNIFFAILIIEICCFLLQLCRSTIIHRILSWLGDRTLELYLCHMFLAGVYRGTSIGQRYQSVIIYFLIILPAAIIVADLIHRRILGAILCRKRNTN